jgi:CRP/FNR family transcriptional regulator
MTSTQPIELPPTPLFAGLEQDDWPDLLKFASRIELGPMEVVFHEGEDADAFFVVLAGTVEVRARMAGGPERPLAHLAPGAVIGETSLLLGAPHSASIYATEPCTLLKFPKDAFLELVKERQSGAVRVLYNIAHALAVRLRAADAHIAELSSRPAAGTQVVRNEVDRLRNIFLTEWV